MGKSVFFREAIGSETDITTPTSTQQYALGSVIVIEDTAYKAVKKYMYVKAHDTLTQYGVYIIASSGTAGSECITAVPVDTAATTATDFFSYPCVAEVAFTSGYYGWVCIQGPTTVNTAGTVTTLHACKLTDGAATVTTESATTVSGYTACVAIAGRSGAGSMTAYMVGLRKLAYQYHS